jgi:hypothetical protein
MYRCEVCGQVVGAGNPAHKRIVEIRERDYSPRPEAGGGQNKPSAGRRRRRGDPGGTGHEIVREQLVCETCAAALAAEQPAEP